MYLGFERAPDCFSSIWLFLNWKFYNFQKSCPLFGLFSSVDDAILLIIIYIILTQFYGYKNDNF